ncbi:MAG: PAS domain S-box protein, partial [Ignavibacteriae bacterium]|nr:PAS domain S-box protein [Ignavibacteriota bacterium]
IMNASDGSVWSGTSGGLEIRNNDGTMQTVSSIFNTPLGVITGIAEDNEKNIWISSGASFDGAYRWDGKKWKPFFVSADSNGLRFHKIKKDKSGNLWFLGLGKSSMEYDTRGNVYLYKQGMFIPWGDEHGFNGERVYSFSEGKNGERWFGTWKGLYRWRPSKNEHQQVGTWTHWTTQQGLMQNRIFTLACDLDGKVWFGHGMEYNFGLGFVDSKDSVHYYHKSDGLVNNNVWDIAVDSSGKVWIATLGGLSCYDHGEWLTFNERSGLPLERLWPILPIENKVYVGTQGRGVAILNVDETMTPVPRLRIEQPVVEAGKVFVQWKPLAHEGELEPKEILTRYRLDSEVWSAWSLLHEITYNDLPSGEHTFNVQARGLFGQYNKAGQSVKFTVIPPFMLRPLFYIPTSGLFIGLISLLFIMHFRKVRHRNEIKQNEAKFRSVTETTSSAIIVYDDDLNIIFVNTGTEKLTCYKKEQLMYMKFSDLIHEDHIKWFLHEEGKRKGDTTVPHRGELKMFNRSGEMLWVDMTRGWMRFQDGVHTIATAIDITERKRAEEALRESKERYKIITELISDYAYLDKVEENGWLTIVWMTDSFTRLTGYTIDEARTPDFLQRYIHPEDFEINMRDFRNLLAGKPLSHEGRARTKEGKILWLHHEAFPIVEKITGRVTHIYGAAHDITERKQKEAELHKLSSELTQTEQRERKNLSSFLHDNIGQSLVFSKLKLESVIHSLAGKKETEEIKEAVIVLQSAIADTRTATFELYPPTLTESGLHHAVRWLIQKMEAQHHLHISIEQADECVLPEETKTILFNCVRESFLNIVKHAMAKHVWVRLENHGEMFRLIIRDDGVGFDIAQLERRAETTSFGLFNLRQQLLHLHGTLEIESQQGRGTSIIVSVPIQK